MAQLAEAGGLNPPKYGFKSHWGHGANMPSQGSGGSADAYGSVPQIRVPPW